MSLIILYDTLKKKKTDNSRAANAPRDIHRETDTRWPVVRMNKSPNRMTNELVYLPL